MKMNFTQMINLVSRPVTVGVDLKMGAMAHPRRQMNAKIVAWKGPSKDMRPIGVERQRRLCNSKPTALIRDDDSQKEARKTMPIALLRDDEPSKYRLYRK